VNSEHHLFKKKKKSPISIFKAPQVITYASVAYIPTKPSPSRILENTNFLTNYDIKTSKKHPVLLPIFSYLHPSHFLEPSYCITDGVDTNVAHVKLSRRIWEHRKHIKFWS